MAADGMRQYFDEMQRPELKVLAASVGVPSFTTRRAKASRSEKMICMGDPYRLKASPMSRWHVLSTQREMSPPRRVGLW